MATVETEPVQGELVGEFTLDLNSMGEIRISTKYSDTAFVIEDNQTQEFIQKLSLLESLKKTHQKKVKKCNNWVRQIKATCPHCLEVLCYDEFRDKIKGHPGEEIKCFSCRKEFELSD